MEHSTAFKQAVCKMTLTNIFFTALYYNLKVERDDDMDGIACTDGVRLKYNGPLFEQYFPTTTEQVSVIVHELLHVILYHSLRRGIRDPLLWNIACDFAVNALLKQYGFIMKETRRWAQVQQKEGWLLDPQFNGMSAERIYDIISKDAQKSQPKQGQGQPGQGQPQLGHTGRDVMDYDQSAAENEGKSAAEVEREIGIASEKALQTAKCNGQVPQGMEGALEAAQVEKEPWFQHLRRYISSAMSKQYNWARTDRRRAVALGIVSPDLRTESMGEIIVSIDASGSLTTAQLNAIATHVSDIARECNPKAIIVMMHDTKVQLVERYEGPDYQLDLKRVCSGGTRFHPVFNLVEDEYPDAQLVLMFTDMEGDLNFSFDMCPTVWITSSKDIQPYFGEVIHADFND